MGEYKTHQLIVELIDALRSDVSPEIVLEHLQNNKTFQKTRSDKSFDESLKKLILNCENPKAFQQKYEEMNAKNSETFEPFVEFLGLLSSDTKLKTVIRSIKTRPVEMKKDTSKNGSFNLPEVCNRIKQVGNRKKTALTEAEHERIISKNTRKHQSWDFSFQDIQLRRTELGAIPSLSLENIIIDDLLQVLEGLEGEFIIPEFVVEPTTKRNFLLSQSLPNYIKDLVSQILPLASNYSIIQRFIEDKSKVYILNIDSPDMTNNWSNTSVNSSSTRSSENQRDSFRYTSALSSPNTCQILQALCAALENLLQDYFAVLCQIEGEHKRGNMNLVKIIYYIKPVLHTLEVVADIVAQVSKSDDVGGKVLSLLHERASSLTGDLQAQKICVFLTREACKPYMRILDTWIHEGTIHDPHQEFMVEDNERISKRDVPLALDYADYWEKRYLLRRNRMPRFLNRVDDIVLRTGKYLNVIRQCGKTITPPQSVEPLVYGLSEAPLEATIKQAYAYASKTLLEMLMTDYDLPGRMRSVKHYFLLDQGDFIVQFMDATERELAKNIDDIVPMRLESLLELTLRVSGANVDPYKDDIRTELLPYNLETQMSKILNISAPETQTLPSSSSAHANANAQGKLHLSGVESFTFGYDVKWPISLIFNRSRIFCYQIIFRHLFYCKHVERQLCGVWICNKEAKRFPAHAAAQYRAAFALRQRMLGCVQNLEYHMMVEVIEPGWAALMHKITKVINVDDLITCHEDFVEATLQNCMITETELLRLITRLCAVCIEFCDFIQEMRQYYVDAELRSMMTSSMCDSVTEAVTGTAAGGTAAAGSGTASMNSSTMSSSGFLSFGTLNKPTSQMETSLDSSVSFSDKISSLDKKFTVILMSLFDKINESSTTSASAGNTSTSTSNNVGGDKLINVVNRFHFNSYYNQKREQMYAGNIAEAMAK